MLSPRLRHRYGSPPGSMTSTKSRNAMSTFLRERSTSRHCSPCYSKEEAFKAPCLPYVFRREDIRAKDKLMVEQQTLTGLLGAAMAGTSIKLGESMTSLEMAAKSPDLPDSVRERIEAVLDTLETGVCRRLGHALKIAAGSFNDLSEKRWAAAVVSTWKGTTLEAKINHDHPASLGQLFRGDVKATALEFADRNRRLDLLLHLKHEGSSGSGHGLPMMKSAGSRPPQQGQGFKSQGNFPAQGGGKKRKHGSRGNKHNKLQKGNQGNQRASGRPLGVWPNTKELCLHHQPTKHGPFRTTTSSQREMLWKAQRI